VWFYCSRPWLVVSSQINLHPEYERELWHLAQDHSELLLLEACSGDLQGNYSVRCRGKEVFQYPHVLQVLRKCCLIRCIFSFSMNYGMFHKLCLYFLTDFTAVVKLWFSSVSPSKCWGSTFQLVHVWFLPHLFTS
jgi:hypothetical protein